MRPSIILCSVIAFALPLPVLAEWLPILPGASERAVATPTHAAVMRDGVIWILRDDGSVVGRMGSREHGAPSGDRRASHEEAEKILDFLGVAEADRDTDWASDLLDDERTLDQRRDARPPLWQAPTAIEPHSVLASGGGDIWIAGGRGLLRIGPSGQVVRERGRQAVRGALAASPRGWLMARPDGLGLLALDGGEDRFVPLATPAVKVALSASGRRWAWTGPRRIGWAGEDSRAETFGSTSEVLDLAYCGETLVALLADSLLAVPADATPEMRSRDIHARRFLCPADRSMPWLAVGAGVLVSFDQGQHWKAIDTPPGLDITDIAATAHHIWLATKQGLYVSTNESEPVPSLPHVTRSAAWRGRRGRGAVGWLSWLPKVSVRASAEFATSGQQLEALALAAFPLDPRQLPIAALALDESADAVPEKAQSRRTERVVDLRDLDGDCLNQARRKAVELAMTEPERARSYVSRAGRAAWLPEMRVLVSRRYGRSESLDLSSSSTALSSPLGIDTVNDIRYEARATWDLAKLVFSTEELAAQNQALHMAELRRDIESNVNRLYFERRRLALDVASTDRIAGHLRVSEIDAELDSLSAGAFGACTANQRGRHEGAR